MAAELSPDGIDELHDTALDAAAAAAAILVSMQDGEALDTQTKNGQPHNQVTAADLAAERAILNLIHERFPDHDVISEERGAAHRDSPYQWIIDPLDATNNYAHGLPHFAVSVALYHHGEALLGVVHDPIKGEVFAARRGAGATLNGTRLCVSQRTALSQCMLVTGFYYDRGAMMQRTLDQIASFFRGGIVGIRRSGCASLDLCYVAAGRFDAFWELKLAPWDYAAGAVVVREAGGLVTDARGRGFDLELDGLVASNGLVHQAVLEVLGLGSC